MAFPDSVKWEIGRSEHPLSTHPGAVALISASAQLAGEEGEGSEGSGVGLQSTRGRWGHGCPRAQGTARTPPAAWPSPQGLFWVWSIPHGPDSTPVPIGQPQQRHPQVSLRAPSSLSLHSDQANPGVHFPPNYGVFTLKTCQGVITPSSTVWCQGLTFPVPCSGAGAGAWLCCPARRERQEK